MHWTYTHAALAHGAVVFAGLLIYVTMTRAGEQRRYPSAAIAWVMSITFMPYLGIPLFLLLGTRKIRRPQHGGVARECPLPNPPGVPVWATQSLDAMSVAPAAQCAAVRFFADGAQALDALLALIANARERIDLCTFILDGDASGDAVVDALVARARQGLRVRVMLDAFGCMEVPQRQIHTLHDAGIAVQFFMPFLHNPLRGRTNLRNHRKMTIADSDAMWCGGRNLADEYFSGDSEKKAWVDLNFVVDGPVVAQAQQLFDADWATTLPGTEASQPCAVPAPRTMEGGVWTQLVPSGPDQAEDTVYGLLVTAAYQAKNRILLATPYYVPEQALQYSLCMAARRGVRVALLVPARSNHRLADLARERDLRELVHAGAEVYLVPYMMHAKAAVIDEEFALCGSANLDGRSLFLNHELMMAFYSPDEVDWLSSWFAAQFACGSLHRGAKPPFLRDVLEGVVRAVGFQL